LLMCKLRNEITLKASIQAKYSSIEAIIGR